MTTKPDKLMLEQMARAILKADEVYENPDDPTADWYRANPDNPQFIWQTYLPHAEAALQVMQSYKDTLDWNCEHGVPHKQCGSCYNQKEPPIVNGLGGDFQMPYLSPSKTTEDK